jgi:hypothetical protein
MGRVDQLWGDRFSSPVPVLTADQDWAPEWAMERFQAFVEEAELPVHVFVTNRSQALERAAEDPRVTLGAHPNFLPGSSHGETPEQVISTCRSLVPDASSFRSHAYAEDAYTHQMLREAGFETDSNLCLFLQPGIVPLVHANGLLRLPVFLDDDSLLLWDRDRELDLEPMAPALASPGLKILNFHPVLFALNCPSAEHYRLHRDAVYAAGSEAQEPFEGRGTATVLAELIERMQVGDSRFSSFEEVAGQAWGALRDGDVPRPYGWGS